MRIRHSMSWGFTTVFSPKSFIILALIFRSLMYINWFFFFLYVVWGKGWNVLFLHVDIHLSQLHFLKTLFFPHWIVLASLSTKDLLFLPQPSCFSLSKPLCLLPLRLSGMPLHPPLSFVYLILQGVSRNLTFFSMFSFVLLTYRHHPHTYLFPKAGIGTS